MLGTEQECSTITNISVSKHELMIHIRKTEMTVSHFTRHYIWSLHILGYLVIGLFHTCTASGAYKQKQLSGPVEQRI